MNEKLELGRKFYSEELFEEHETVITYYHRYDNYGEFYMHYHSFQELNVVISGEGTHYVGDKVFRIKPGDIFIIPPFVKHNYVFDDKNFNVFHILFKNEFFVKYNSILKNISGYYIFFDIDPYLRIYKKNTNLLISIADKMQEYGKDFARLNSFADSGSQQKIEMYTLFVISSICQGLVEDVSQKNDLDALYYIMKAIEYLQNRYAEKLSVDDLAREANMSKSTFQRYFKYYYDTTPLDYLNRYRVRIAEQLLTETDRNIITIAQDCGFFDSSHFIKTFGKIVGMSPLTYRNEKTKNN